MDNNLIETEIIRRIKDRNEKHFAESENYF